MNYRTVFWHVMLTVAFVTAAGPQFTPLELAPAVADDGGDGGDGGDGDGDGDGDGGDVGDAGDPGAGGDPGSGGDPGVGGPSGFFPFFTQPKSAGRTQQRRRRARRRGVREIVAAGLTDDAIRRLKRRGYRVRGDRKSSVLGSRLTRLRLPKRRGIRSGRRLARRLANNTRIFRNSLYRRPSRELYRKAGRACGTQCASFELTGWSEAFSACSEKITLGMIDTGIDLKHPALRKANIEVVRTARNDRRKAGSRHGTAVASLIVGSSERGVAGVAPGARLIAVNAFHRIGRSERADAFDIIVAMGELLERKVQVINMSLTGPRNDLLREAVDKVVGDGVQIVAAVGHPGRSVGYPARYDGVIGVSAVDTRLRATRRAARGLHVSFAAPGVGVTVAAPGNRTRRVTGSSFATPFVSAAFAVGMVQIGSRQRVTSLLASSAKDLGAAGRDPVYGWGLIQYAALKECKG